MLSILLQNTHNGVGTGGVQIFTLLILFVIVLIGAYFSTRWISNLQYQQNKGKNMQIIETLRITQTKAIQIIRIGTRYFVISVSKENINLITEIQKEDIKDYIDKQTNVNFTEQFRKILNKRKGNN